MSSTWHHTLPFFPHVGTRQQEYPDFKFCLRAENFYPKYLEDRCGLFPFPQFSPRLASGKGKGASRCIPQAKRICSDAVTLQAFLTRPVRVHWVAASDCRLDQGGVSRKLRTRAWELRMCMNWWRSRSGFKHGLSMVRNCWSEN